MDMSRVCPEGLTWEPLTTKTKQRPKTVEKKGQSGCKFVTLVVQHIYTAATEFEAPTALTVFTATSAVWVNRCQERIRGTTLATPSNEYKLDFTS